jgi:hypothetical protein
MDRVPEAAVMDAVVRYQETEPKSCHLRHRCKAGRVTAQDSEVATVQVSGAGSAPYPVRVRALFHLLRDFRARAMAAEETVARLSPEMEMWSRPLLRWEAAEARAEMVQVGTAVVVQADVAWVIFREEIWVQAHRRAVLARGPRGRWSRWSH